MSWNQDREAVRKALSGLHLKVNTRPQLATVSGVVSTKTALITYVDTYLPAFSMVTTKSFQVMPNPGNREPIICEMESGSFGNSVGLKNPGMEVALAELRDLRKNKPMRSLLNVSVSASSIEDFITLVGAFAEVADCIELNFSCPHAQEGYGSSIGCSPQIAASYMRSIREAYPHCNALIFPKLTPNVDDIGLIAQEVMAAGADGIVAINTVGPEVHRDPGSGKPILQNALGGKGGKSGRWILEEALACIRSIRQAIGPTVPLIGMGGVTTGADVAAMVRSGADLVGVGSAFGKVHQKDWPAYSNALVTDAEVVLLGGEDPAQASQYYSQNPSMAYQERKILTRQEHGQDTVVLTLEGSWEYEAGQFVFLWIPQVGEKPFSIAVGDPLTFVIKRRGPFTAALFNLKVGDSLFVRGLYGQKVALEALPKAFLIAGGTGVAVLPALAQRLKEQGTTMQIFVGTSESAQEGVLKDTLEQYGPLNIVPDHGTPGRVLQLLEAGEESSELACYLVGPTPFMRIGAEKLVGQGVPATHIHLSLELSTLCGIGMCGECLCGDKLTCEWGTFMPYDYILEHAAGLLA